MRIAFVDATAEPAHADKHWEAIEACATAGGEARRGSRASPGTLEEVAAWRPSFVHLMAHGAKQGRPDFPGPSVRAS